MTTSSKHYQTLLEKVNDIYKLYTSGLYLSSNFRKYIRIPLTEQASLRALDEKELRCVFHYCSSNERCINREAKTVEEHVVPIKTITDILTKQFIENPSEFNKEFIINVLERLLWIVFITSEEDRRLSKCGLKQKMPDKWNWRYDSPFVRYDIAGISIEYLKNTHKSKD